MTKEEIVQYWIETSDGNYITMRNLIDSKDYAWALFMGHLVIEKLIKAYYAKNIGDSIPYIHDLLRLALKSGLTVDQETMDKLDEITTFNIKARYDDYKRDFSKLCTHEFTMEKLKTLDGIRSWLKMELEK